MTKFAWKQYIQSTLYHYSICCPSPHWIFSDKFVELQALQTTTAGLACLLQEAHPG